MPTTVSSLLVFVATLTPGFVYLVRTEARLPARRHTAVRETALIVSASLAVYAVVLTVFGMLRVVLPDLTPDVGQLLSNPQGYLAERPVEITLWGLGCLVAATGLAAVAAVPPTWLLKPLSRIDTWPVPIVLDYIRNRHRHLPSQSVSGWAAAFTERPDRQVFVGLRLKDGSYLEGSLLSFNSQIAESNDRSIQLGRPVRIRALSDGESDLVDWDVDAVIVPARQINTISVNYLPVEDLEYETV